MKVVATYNIKGFAGKAAAAVNLAWLAGQSGLLTLKWNLNPCVTWKGSFIAIAPIL
ncbi:MAG: hypothetical protein JW832_09715 [Deltaproteobacteria bacterium]|nr:hypothetical protein [Deltaproteobacteria bacterium]